MRRYAVRAAEQNFPLEAMLHAFRCTHRAVARWLRDAAGQDALAAVEDFVLDYVDTVATIATGEYVRRTRQLSEAEADRRSHLLTMLLRGYDESDRRVTRLIRSAGYLEQRQSYCVILARPVNLAEMDNPARANRLLAATREAHAVWPARQSRRRDRLGDPAPVGLDRPAVGSRGASRVAITDAG